MYRILCGFMAYFADPDETLAKCWQMVQLD